jgi:hypothetical protein
MHHGSFYAEEGPLPGISAGQRYKVVETVLLRDINLNAFGARNPSTGIESALSPADAATDASTVAIIATKAVVTKEGTSATTVMRITLHCSSESQKTSLQEAIANAAEKCQSAARDLQERRLNAAPSM